MRLAAAALLCALAPGALAQELLVTPRVVIYPRTIIRGDMVELRELAIRRIGATPPADLSEVVGKAARVTLVPGQPIPRDAVGEPQIVQIGSSVALRFRAAGVEIAAAGVALQAAAAGERVRARNAATSVIVTGRLAADGTVHIEDQP